MDYMEMTIEEASKLCKGNTTILVATKYLEDAGVKCVFTKRMGIECDELFDDAQTVIKSFDDFVKQLNVFTEKQDIYNIIPHGVQRTILLKE